MFWGTRVSRAVMAHTHENGQWTIVYTTCRLVDGRANRSIVCREGYIVILAHSRGVNIERKQSSLSCMYRWEHSRTLTLHAAS